MITYHFFGLVISTLLIIALFVFIKKQTRQTGLKKSFLFILLCLLIWCLGLIAQIIFTHEFNIEPIYFDYFVYIGTCFTPVTFLMMSLKFTKPNKKINEKRIVALCSIVPIICFALRRMQIGALNNMSDWIIMISCVILAVFTTVSSVWIIVLAAIIGILLGRFTHAPH